MTLYRVVMVTPSGLPTTVEVRAPSQEQALTRVNAWKPDGWTVARDANGLLLVTRRPTPHAESA